MKQNNHNISHRPKNMLDLFGGLRNGADSYFGVERNRPTVNFQTNNCRTNNL